MLLIFVTLFVMKLSLENVIATKEVQPSNILLISFTFKVSKLDKSKELKACEPLNIPAIFSTFSVFNLLKSIFFNLLSANI